MTLTHVHLLLNHVPTIGTAVALGLLIISFFRRNDDLRRVSLEVFFVIAVLTIPAYLSGVSSQQVLLNNPDVSQTFVNAHQDAAMWAFLLMQFAGAFAWLGLWQYRRVARMAPSVLFAVLLLSSLAFAASARAANLGGEIRHPEIIVGAAASEAGASEAAAAEEAGLGTDPSWITAAGVGRKFVDLTWAWPASEAVHFIGLFLIFGVVLIVNLRMMGFMEEIPYSAVHRLLPWAAVGFAVNAITGMLFVTATPEQYGENISFLWKIVFLVVAGFNLLYATVFEGPWEVEAGQKAPLRVKLAGASAIVAWGCVMFFGRMLPFLGNAF
jgi:hypothetical protein